MKSNMINKDSMNLIRSRSESMEKSQSEFELINETANLSLKQKLSKRYKEEINGQIIKSQNVNNDYLFYKREKNLVEIIGEMEENKQKIHDTGEIMNGFLFELQKLIGLKNPQNFFGDITEVDNENLVKKLQKLYKFVHKKTHESFKKNHLPIDEKFNCCDPYNFREEIILRFRLENCELDSSYRVRVYSYFKKNNEKIFIGETHDDFPNSNGTIIFSHGIEVLIYYEREQEILFHVHKNKDQKKYPAKYSIIKLLKNKDGEIQIKLDENTQECLIFGSEFSSKPRIRIELKATLAIEGSNSKLEYIFMFKRKDGDSDKIKDLHLVYESEPKPSQKSSNLVNFSKLTMNSYEFCLGDLDMEMILIITDKTKLKIILDRYKTSINKLIENPKIQISPNCYITFEIIINKTYSFCEFLKKNLQVNMSLAIDFTKSNGDIRTKKSLHELNPTEDNPYEKAIKSCGEIIAQYDTDNIFPCFGYGAILQGEKQTSHFFNLNLTENPNIQGIDNVLNIYNETLEKITFSDPTHFAPTIRKIIEFSKEEQKNNIFMYNILVIMTDGKFQDGQETKNAIVEASEYPISIIIVGIGNDGFESMVALDKRCNFLLDSKGRQASRDIIKFIPFKNYETNKKKLSEEIFSEIPTQVVDYFAIKDISPEQFGELFGNK